MARDRLVDFRRWTLYAGLMLLGGLGTLAIGGPPGEPGADQETPIGAKWWPSPYGAEDQRGAANLLTPEKVLAANKLVRKGKIYQLGRLYEHGMPLPGKRHFSLTIPGSPTGGPLGKNQLVSHDELFSGEIGQVGTQFDGLGHVGVWIDRDDYYYNGFKAADFARPYGLEKLGVENVGPIYTRGVLLDVARLRGVDRLPTGQAITASELEACANAAKVKITPGDIVLIRTGHGQLWMKDNATYGEGEPGIGLEAAQWLTDQKIVLIGCDNWAIEVVPSEDPDRPFPVHQWDLTRNGVYHLENLDLEELAADKVVEFAFIFSPLRLKGATGSPGNPLAVR